MDINEPSLMDVAHDRINSTQGPGIIEVAYFPSSEGEGRAFFVVIVGHSYEIYAGHRNQMKALRSKISLVLDKYVEIFMGPWRESQSIFSRIPYHATHGDLSIDILEGPPLNKFLK
ncbi:hypothetical protein HAX54_053097, partial [Datura stramonium]|nr:hypothetical protein [Datura stramonium]